MRFPISRDRIVSNLKNRETIRFWQSALFRVLADSKCREVAPAILNKFGDAGRLNMCTIAIILRHYALADAVGARSVNNLKISLRRPVEEEDFNYAANKLEDVLALAPNQYDCFTDKAKKLPPHDVPISTDVDKVGAALRISRLGG